MSSSTITATLTTNCCEKSEEERIRQGIRFYLRTKNESEVLWTEETCKILARQNVKCLKYAHENGCPWDESTCVSAADYGRLDCLKYAHENGCPWDESTCKFAMRHAAKSGNLDCLKYAHENGCPWDESTSLEAVLVQYSDLECLKYTHENGCPMHKYTSRQALNNHNYDCFTYACEHGCPLNLTESDEFPESELEKIIKYWFNK